MVNPISHSLGGYRAWEFGKSGSSLGASFAGASFALSDAPAPLKTAAISAHARAVIVEALASALVEDFHAISATPGGSPTGLARGGRHAA